MLFVLVKGMETNYTDIYEWESDLEYQNMEKVYGIKDNKRVYRWNHSKKNSMNRPTVRWWCKENKKARKLYQRAFRRKMKQDICNEAFYHIRSRDYKTYGWLTW